MTLGEWRRPCGLPLGLLALVAAAAALAVWDAAGALALERESAHEAQTRENLREIRWALERFAVDYGGVFPAYIHGGDPHAWRCAADPADCLGPIQLLPDPLLRQGYLESYPANPFLKRTQIRIFGWSWDVGKAPATPCSGTGYDPRWGCLPSRGVDDPGLEGVLMGNALSDPHIPGGDTGPLQGSLSPVGSPYYSLGDGDPSTDDWMPGQFLYRSFEGDVSFRAGVPPDRGLAGTFFVLGAYGGLGTSGTDRLHCLDREAAFAPWRGACRPGGFFPDTLWKGEPLRAARRTSQNGGEGYPNVVLPAPPWSQTRSLDILFGNADGHPDGIILWLVSGLEDAIPPPTR